MSNHFLSLELDGTMEPNICQGFVQVQRDEHILFPTLLGQTAVDLIDSTVSYLILHCAATRPATAGRSETTGPRSVRQGGSALRDHLLHRDRLHRLIWTRKYLGGSDGLPLPRRDVPVLESLFLRVSHKWPASKPPVKVPFTRLHSGSLVHGARGPAPAYPALVWRLTV